MSKEGKKILIVDDEINCQTIAGLFLKKIGLNNISTAINGIEAVEKAKSELFDLIIMDIRMPQTNGLEASKNIQDYYRSVGFDTKIVAHTALEKTVAEKHIRESDIKFDDIIFKPIGIKNFQSRILLVLNGVLDGVSNS